MSTRRATTRKDHSTEYNEQVLERISQVESDYSHLSERVDLLHSSQQRGFSDLTKKIDELTKARQFSWPVIWGFIGAVVSILAIAGVLHRQSQEPLLLAIMQNKQSIETHERLPGHAEARIKFANNQQQITFVIKALDKLTGVVEKNRDHSHTVDKDVVALRERIRALERNAGFEGHPRRE